MRLNLLWLLVIAAVVWFIWVHGKRGVPIKS